MTLPELFQLSLHEAGQGLRRQEFSVVELARSYEGRIEETEPHLGSFIALAEPSLSHQAQSLGPSTGQKHSWLWGIPGGIKDNICTSALPTTCASLSLEGFVPPYTATVVSRLEQAGYLCAGKTNLDEFAMGSSTETSAFGPTVNPWDSSRVPGGSSGGSAAAVASGQVAFALGSDTGGSIRQPAAFCGVVGLKPTYGLLSRYGLIAYASSLDQVGIFTRTVYDAALVLQELAAHDAKDATSSRRPLVRYAEASPYDLQGVRIGVPEECFGLSIQPEVSDVVRAAIRALAEAGAHIELCSLPHLPHALAVYRVIAAAEASSNLARFDGVAYGQQGHGDTVGTMIRSGRSTFIGDEVKRRILLGTLLLQRGEGSSRYEHAQRVRTLICRDYERAFSRFDVLACPTTPTVALESGQWADDTCGLGEADLFTAPVNLAGLPAISVPCGLSGALPVGLQLIAPAHKEKRLLGVARAYEECQPFDGNRRGPLYGRRR